MRHSFKRKSGSPVKKKSGFPKPWALGGALLLPLLAGAWWAAWHAFQPVAGRLLTAWPLLAGAVSYGLFQIVFQKPMILYVFGHELTHALAALCSGYSVKSFSASSKGGEVVLSNTNVAVALAPYCFPIYTLLAVGALQLIRHYSALPVSPPWFGFAVGFTFSFHAALTFHALSQRQPDLHHAGPFFSLTAILLANGLVLVLLLKMLYPQDVSLKVFGRDWFELTARLFTEAAEGGRFLWREGADLWRERGPGLRALRP